MKFLLVLLGALSPAVAIAPIPVMTPAQKSVFTGLCRELVAPCCWTQTLTGHQSAAADEVRARIASEIVAGKSPDQIRAGLVTTYGARILAFRLADRQGYLFFAIPATVLAAGSLLTLLYLRRLRRTISTPQ
jgi:cytochrome c-type biogenesis protein CcmH/NrfF